MRNPSVYRSMFRIRPRPAEVAEPDYGDFLTAAVAKSPSGPLASSGPGDLTRWMAIPWQTDTASCLSGYEKPDPNLPAFWPARVPNDVLDEEHYNIIVSKDPLVTDKDRIKAFNTRVKFFRSLGLNAPYLQSLERMLQIFGLLGVVERREQDRTADLPKVLYVELGMKAPIPVGAPVDSHTRVDPEYKSARFRRGSH